MISTGEHTTIIEVVKMYKSELLCHCWFFNRYNKYPLIGSHISQKRDIYSLLPKYMDLHVDGAHLDGKKQYIIQVAFRGRYGYDKPN